MHQSGHPWWSILAIDRLCDWGSNGLQLAYTLRKSTILHLTVVLPMRLTVPLIVLTGPYSGTPMSPIMGRRVVDVELSAGQEYLSIPNTMGNTRRVIGSLNRFLDLCANEIQKELYWKTPLTLNKLWSDFEWRRKAHDALKRSIDY